MATGDAMPGAAEVAAIRERWARAAPGPWTYATDGGGRHAIDDDHGVLADLGNRVRTDRSQRVSDARAIAAAPTDIAALLALVDALTGALARATNDCLVIGVYVSWCRFCHGRCPEGEREQHKADCPVRILEQARGGRDGGE